jgi:hypothetical protein
MIRWVLKYRWAFPYLAAAVLVVAVAAAGFVAWRLYDRDPEIMAADVRPTPELIAKGEYLARAADCAA